VQRLVGGGRQRRQRLVHPVQVGVEHLPGGLGHLKVLPHHHGLVHVEAAVAYQLWLSAQAPLARHHQAAA
jgi:hypothetical protein